jgi:hypothetical protein
MKYALSLLALVSIAVGATTVSAHERFRVIGTVTKATDREIGVKNKDSKTLTITITKRTIIKRDKQPEELTPSVLKVGQSVVVDAYGDSEAELEALDIRIVPRIASKRPE